MPSIWKSGCAAGFSAVVMRSSEPLSVACRGGAARRLIRPRLPVSLVFLRLAHDFLGGEIYAAGRECVADEEIVGLIRIEVRSLLEIGVFDDGERQFDRLWNDLSFQGGDGRLDGNCDLCGSRAGGRAFQAFSGMFRAEFAEAVFRLATERYEGVAGVDHSLDNAGVAALRGDAVE